mmetsp:Transcript_93818/g.265360  ORF Transcript_93818/g.265360 Transcript_93818/m.265360 type:complete len:352 (-) Transcript_93818:102-1157(-)
MLGLHGRLVLELGVGVCLLVIVIVVPHTRENEAVDAAFHNSGKLVESAEMRLQNCLGRTRQVLSHQVGEVVVIGEHVVQSQPVLEEDPAAQGLERLLQLLGVAILGVQEGDPCGVIVVLLDGLVDGVGRRAGGVGTDTVTAANVDRTVLLRHFIVGHEALRGLQYVQRRRDHGALWDVAPLHAIDVDPNVDTEMALIKEVEQAGILLVYILAALKVLQRVERTAAICLDVKITVPPAGHFARVGAVQPHSSTLVAHVDVRVGVVVFAHTQQQREVVGEPLGEAMGRVDVEVLEVPASGLLEGALGLRRGWLAAFTLRAAVRWLVSQPCAGQLLRGRPGRRARKQCATRLRQ